MDPTPKLTRRETIALSLMAASGGAGASAARTPARGAVLLGGPVFVSDQDPDALAAEHVRVGYRAAYCPGVDIKDTARIRAVREAFARHNVVIAEVGAWCNLIAAEDDVRKANVAYVTRQLALADEVGARCCVDYAGTLKPGESWGPMADNFGQAAYDLIVETVRGIIDAVKPKRAKFCLEVMQTCPPDGVDDYLRVIKAIDRPEFGVHLDPANMFYAPRDCFASGRVLTDCCRRLGKWIVSCHAKDLVVRSGAAVHIDECRPGTGVLDYGAYVRGLLSLGRDVPLMLEHLPNEAEYTQAREYIAGVIEAQTRR